MKIAIFTDTYIPEINGVVTSIRNFTELLSAEGHEFLIFCPKYFGYKENNENPNIKILRYPSFSFVTNKATKLSFPSFLNVLDNLREFQPDLIHIQTPLNMGLTGLLASKSLKIKNIQTYHTYMPDFAVYLKPSNIFGFSKLQDEIRNSKIYQRVIESDLAENFGKMRKELNEDFATFNKMITLKRKRKNEKADLTVRFAWNYSRFMYNRANLVLTPSVALKDELKKHGIFAPISVQSNGIELSEFKQKENYDLKNRILHIGRLGPEKNVDVVIKAFAEAAKINDKVELDILGDGPAKKSLMKLARTLKVNHRVHFLGFVKRSYILENIVNYDLFVTASTMETQGLVILESMACGLPIIGVDKLAIPEVVKDGRNGYVVKPGDFKRMGERMLKILEDESMRQKMGHNSLSIVKKHELSLMAKKLEGNYEKINEKVLEKV